MKRLLLLALTACATPVDEPVPDAGPLCTEWALPAPVGTLHSEELVETSGLAASRLHPGVLYAHNDSGSDAVLFALHPDGSSAGRFVVEGVDNRDWEAMAAGPCPGKSGHCLYLGDVGDNVPSKHPSVRLIVLPEPEDLSATSVEPLAVLTVTYDEGPRDCEALFVDSAGNVYLLEKYGTGLLHGVWRVKTEAFAVTDAEAERIAWLSLSPQHADMITDADLHPTRPALLVRTYFSVQLFEGDDVLSMLEAESQPLEGGGAGFESQGEAIAWAAEGASFFTTSEGAGATVSEWACER